ncbi:MAG: hybrid sensor histidine kinase/response regulator, partial [Gemmatimonadaceae bacterium]
ILVSLEATEKEPNGDDSALIEVLHAWIERSGVQTEMMSADDLASAFSAERGDVPSTAGLVGRNATSDVAKPAATVSTSASVHARTTPPSESANLAIASAVSTPLARVADSHDRNARGDGSGEGKQSVADSTLRVDVVLLNKLMNMVGELVLARNQLIQLVAAEEDSVYATPVQHLNRVTTDLQEAVMKTRMQPIGSAWTKLPRLVRDLAKASGKFLELEMHGAETELDRQILQAIQDPLTHMVRNSGDHGVEPPEVRRAAGKRDRGTIRLNAFHEGGHVILEIADDGAGINVDRVRAKAIERGLVKSDVAATLSDSQIFRFIFEPGFSTAEKVTNVSGRGVGMDVVRSNIEKVGGTVELSSRLGEGTTVRVKIPLTLAIISALLVGTSGETFAIPQIGVVELVRVTEEARERIENVHGARFFRLRDTLLPLVSLSTQFALGGEQDASDYNIVVCQVGKTRFGLEVDEVFDTQEIVVKPTGRLIKHLSVYGGCTILGDGRVIMILDTTGIANQALPAQQNEITAARVEAAVKEEWEGERETVLLFDAGLTALQAVPLSLVARLEEIPMASIEQAGGRHLVQYRSALLPLIAASPNIDLTARDPRPVVVFTDNGRSMGLAVEEIRDIVEERLVLDHGARREGVLGVSVIGGRATEIIDTNHFLRQAFGNWFAPATTATTEAPRVLLVDDSTFFLNLVIPVVRAAGYRVATATDGKDALQRLERGERFEIIVSDIDMATVDG